MEAVMRSKSIYALFAVVCALLLIIGCSGGGNPVAPSSSDSSALTGQSAPEMQPANSSLLGYYDIYYDIQANKFEVVADRTAAYTLNIVPFLNLMNIPHYGITFGSILVHDDDPTFLGVDVEFNIYHPFPGIDQYNAYDLRGVVIGNGATTLEYDGIRASRHGTDLWMKNPDGYTRWFNPTEFTTELIFGYSPGGFQNLAGDAMVNPYKYYSKHLGKDDDLWNYLTGDNNWDGMFENGLGRTMEIEFPLPPNGIGLMFGYAVVVAWEEQGATGPYHPVHVAEPVAVSVTQTPDVWYNETDGPGGNLILDIDLFAWNAQPSTVKVESTVLDHIAFFDFATYASPGGEHYSTWHVEAPAGAFTGVDNHDAWIIAECEAFDYKNGLPEIPSSDGLLAAFFRTDIGVLGEPLSLDPVAVAEIVSEEPFCSGNSIEFSGLGSYDMDEGGNSIVSYAWDFDEDGIYGDPYDSGTDSNPVLLFDTAGTYNIDLEVTDDEGATDTLDTPLVLVIGTSPLVIGINPDSGGIDTIITGAEVSGADFDSVAQVSLVKSDDPLVVIEADNEVTSGGGTLITCDIDLDSSVAESGVYDVVVTNSTGCSGQDDGGFMVTSDPIWWENNMYNPEHTGYNPTANTPDPSTMSLVSGYPRSAPGYYKHLTPIVAGDKIFYEGYGSFKIGLTTPYIYCHDLATGNQLWSAPIKETTYWDPIGWNTPNINNGFAYWQDTSTGDEYFIAATDQIYCFDANSSGSATPIWKYHPSPLDVTVAHWLVTQLTIYDGKVLARSAQGILYIVDIVSGSLDYEVDVTGAGWGGMAASNGYAYVLGNLSGSSYLSRVDIATGDFTPAEDSWLIGSGYYCSYWVQPCISDGRAYMAVSNTSHLVCMAIDDPGYADGTVIWDAVLPIGTPIVSGAAKLGDDIFVAAGSYGKGVIAITDLGAGYTQKWYCTGLGANNYFDANITVATTPSYPNGLVVAPDRYSDSIYFINIDTGILAYTIDLPGSFMRNGVSFAKDFMVAVTESSLFVYQ